LLETFEIMILPWSYDNFLLNKACSMLL
jgi:hypothetical protein